MAFSNLSERKRAVPAPTLHRKIFARYWYKPSLTLFAVCFFESVCVVLSAIMPPATPPVTGINPKRESLLISEKISLELRFFFSGKITLKSSSFSGDLGRLPINKSICFGESSCNLAVSKAFKIFWSLIFVFCKNFSTASVCTFCNSEKGTLSISPPNIFFPPIFKPLVPSNDAPIVLEITIIFLRNFCFSSTGLCPSFFWLSLNESAIPNVPPAPIKSAGIF